MVPFFNFHVSDLMSPFPVSVWTSANNGTPAWTFTIPAESVGPFGAFGPFVSANGATVVYGPRSFDGKFPAGRFRPAIFWWTGVGSSARYPSMNKLDLTVWPGTRLGFSLSGNGAIGTTIVGPYIWQIDLVGMDILAQVPFNWPWDDVCSSFSGQYFGFGKNITNIWSWDGSQKRFTAVGQQSNPNGAGFKCAFAADVDRMVTTSHFAKDGNLEWVVSAFDLKGPSASLAWFNKPPAEKSTSAPTATAVSITKDGNWVAVSASSVSQSSYKVAVYDGNTPVYLWDAPGVVRSLALFGNDSSALLAVGGAAEAEASPAVYSFTIAADE